MSSTCEVVPSQSAAAPPLPGKWAAALIARLSALYGVRFREQWAWIADPQVLTQVWADELAGYTGPEISRGLEACRRRAYPPSIPEFALLCRPKLDVMECIREAVAQLVLRRQGLDVWSDPVIYWAALRVGEMEVLSLSADVLKVRFSAALAAVQAEGPVPDVPPRMLVLPEPGKGVTDSATARRAISALSERMAGGSDQRDVASESVRKAREIMGRIGTEKPPMVGQIEWARTVLQRKGSAI